MNLSLRSFLVSGALAVAASIPAGSATAAAIVESVKGEVRAQIDPTRHGPVLRGDRYQPGTTFKTAPAAQLVLRMDDGQRIVLNENSEFKISQYSYNEAQASADRSVLDLIKGALRVVTGAIGKRNPNAFALRVPQATIGIRGTDFMVALVNPAYISVLQGTVTATNAAGTAVFGAGSIGTIASSTVLGTTISAAALPASVSSAFSSMSAVTFSAAATTTAGTAGGAAGGAAGAAGAAAGAALPATAIAAGALAAGAAAASGDGGTTTTTHH